MKKLCFLIGLLLIANVMAQAPPIPMPVQGTIYVDGQPMNGLLVTVTNLANNEVLTNQEVESLKTSSGTFMFDMGKFPTFPNYGDTIQIKVCDEVDCVQTITMDYQFPKELVFNVGGVTYICSDGSQVSNPDDCPEEITSEIKAISNEDDSIVSIDAFYYQLIHVELDNNKLIKLQDKSIDFDDDEYDIKETLIFRGMIKTSLDDEDYLIDPYLVIEEEDIQYRYNFEDVIDLGLITEDEPLKIDLLGSPLEIISATSDTITLLQGELIQDLKVHDKVTVDDLELEILAIGIDIIRVNYNGVSETINEEDTIDVGGIQVYVKDVFQQEAADGLDTCDIRVGVDIIETIESGDEYNDLWDWDINLPNYIGIVNIDDYNELDEDTKPLGLGDSIILPNDFATIKFNDLSTPEMTDINVEIEDGMIHVTGPTDAFDDEYDELFIDGVGIYDNDLNLIGTKVRVGDSDTYIEVGSMKLGKLTISLGMNDITYDGVNFNAKDADYLGKLGLVFKDPEQGVTDKDNFQISIPEEQPEATITIGAEPEEAEPQPSVAPVDCPAVPVCTEKECTDIVCPAQNVCPPEKVCEECTTIPPDDNQGAMIITAIAALLSAGAGIYFTKNKALGKNSAIKIHVNRNGEEVVTHRHPGIRGYHEPNTSHRDANEKHPRGQLLPHFEKNESGVWVYKG